jgi:hypothetical protein
MTQVLTLRIEPELLAKAESRAAQLGLGRGKYVRDLIEQDVALGAGKRAKFGSEDFIGSVALGAGPYTNQRVRETVRKRLRAKHEANR